MTITLLPLDPISLLTGMCAVLALTTLWFAIAEQRAAKRNEDVLRRMYAENLAQRAKLCELGVQVLDVPPLVEGVQP